MSAAAIAVLAAYFLLLQGFIGGMAQGAMAASAVDPLHVICSSSGATVGGLPAGEKAPGKAADCPCCTLCRLACMAMPVVLGGAEAFIHLAARSGDAVQHPTEIVFPLPLRRLIGEPRAPPPLS